MCLHMYGAFVRENDVLEIVVDVHLCPLQSLDLVFLVNELTVGTSVQPRLFLHFKIVLRLNNCLLYASVMPVAGWLSSHHPTISSSIIPFIASLASATL